MVGLLVRLTKGIWGSGKVVVLDGGFCVLKAIVKLRKSGCYAAALIKKRRYWPKYVNSDKIKKHFKEKEVGYVDSITGTLDETRFDIVGMKEPDYVMMMMTNYGTLEIMGDEKKRNLSDGSTTTFKYPEVIHNHFQY